jgi:nitrate/nitrite transport system permease protein
MFKRSDSGEAVATLPGTGRLAANSQARPGIDQRWKAAVSDALVGLLYTTGGIGILGLIWLAASAANSRDLPGPVASLGMLWQLLSNPFYDLGPNNKGIGIQLASSVGRVFTGFLLASALAIPVGFLMGASEPGRRLLYPVVQILRPVSPLAWFPLGLAVFKSAPTATVFVIFMTAIWPTLINTAFGVMSLPEDHRNVARVFRFSRWKYVTKVLFPYSLPHVLTGLRLSMGVAWMVIVAGEMLSGGIGIGFFVWDSWNQLNLEKVLAAILIIGVVGLALDRSFEWAGRRFAYGS